MHSALLRTQNKLLCAALAQYTTCPQCGRMLPMHSNAAVVLRVHRRLQRTYIMLRLLRLALPASPRLTYVQPRVHSIAVAA